MGYMQALFALKRVPVKELQWPCSYVAASSQETLWQEMKARNAALEGRAFRMSRIL